MARTVLLAFYINGGAEIEGISRKPQRGQGGRRSRETALTISGCAGRGFEGTGIRVKRGGMEPSGAGSAIMVGRRVADGERSLESTAPSGGGPRDVSSGASRGFFFYLDNRR